MIFILNISHLTCSIWRHCRLWHHWPCYSRTVIQIPWHYWLCLLLVLFIPVYMVRLLFLGTHTAWTYHSLWPSSGSVLVPLLYILYTADLTGNLLPLSALSLQFANDMQAFIHGSVTLASLMAEHFLEAFLALDFWMASNRLHLLNTNKAKFIWLGGPCQYWFRVALLQVSWRPFLHFGLVTSESFWIQFSLWLTM